MLKNYLKIALRNLWKHKGYSFINIAGLAVGMACALFIFLWAQDELSFDRFHANAGNLYRVEQDQKGGQGVFHVTVTPYPMGPALKDEIPEVKDSTRSTSPGTLLLRYQDKAFFESGIRTVDPSFLTMFTFPLLSGQPKETALARPYSLVMAEDMARKYFGGENPVGRTVTVNNRYSFTVTAVMKKAPANSTLRPDMLMPFDFIKELGQYSESWGDNSILTWVELRAGGINAAINRKITDLVGKRDRQAAKDTDFMLTPLVDLRLYGYFGFGRTNRGIQYVHTFAAIALFVLLIACINFMNLATARSANRTREVGLRKVVGASRNNIAGQFYGESILTTVLAVSVSLCLVVFLLPAFNALAEKHIVPGTLLSLKFLGGILAVTVITGLISGSYPAALLSAFTPAMVLRGRVNAGARAANFRKALVVIQFGISIFLLIGMGTVGRQLQYMRTKKLGYDKEHLVYMPLRGDASKTYAAFKEGLLRDPKILAVTGTQQPPTTFGSNSWGADWDGKAPDRPVLIGCGLVDFDYVETLKIDVLSGRPFSRSFPSDRGRAFLVNEEVPKLMGIKTGDAVGRRFSFMGANGTIVGVMKNFHYESVRASIEPLALLAAPDQAYYAVARLRAGDIPAALSAVRTVWARINPLYPFEYRFFDDDFDQMYRSDERMGAILRYFTTIALIIACLGLFGLASFMAEQRTKEIGVRKVLGASSAGIVVLFSKEFVRWVAVANIIAWPVGYFVMRSWLQGFAYRAALPWWLFVICGAGTIVIAVATVSFQSVRAALSNPVTALKYE